MASIVSGIVGESGSGKTTSIMNMDPKSTVYINADKKIPSFFHEFKGMRYLESSNLWEIAETISLVNSEPNAKHIKSIVIDTVNGIMTDDEMARMREKNYDKWIDLAVCVYELISLCNHLRPDLVVYPMFHEEAFVSDDGIRSRRILTSGKKLQSIKLERKMTIVLYSIVRGSGADNKYFFETQARSSSGKSPIKMFKDFTIPNDLSVVNKTIRDYYKLDQIEYKPGKELDLSTFEIYKNS